MKRALTDRGIKALKAAKPGQRYETMDAIVPGLGVRVTDKGTKTFVLRCPVSWGQERQLSQAGNQQVWRYQPRTGAHQGPRVA